MTETPREPDTKSGRRSKIFGIPTARSEPKLSGGDCAVWEFHPSVRGRISDSFFEKTVIAAFWRPEAFQIVVCWQGNSTKERIPSFDRV
jgi:hypothetical protein